MKIATVGIDLAKNVFQVPGAGERGKPALRKQLIQTPLTRDIFQLMGAPITERGSTSRLGPLRNR
jgi:hypothetical protein